LLHKEARRAFDTPGIRVTVALTGYMFEETAEARLRCSSISLEDGADEAWLNGEPIGLCEEGMCFPSRWQFDPGTTLAMTLEICGGGKKVRAEGVVVGCEATGERLWSVTLIFLDAPVGLQEFKDSKFEIRGEVGGGLLT
jgi:hypothetical protein